ncbi:hypothetical protein KM043_007247 [Ampulex compressa]|nr:hypothetical protein KM043_007247 [Ampulex compressa]
MSYKDDFNVFVGGKSGVFKGAKIDKKACILKNIQSLVSIKDDDEVTTISWGDDEEKEILIACGVKRDRSVKIYDTECGMFTCSFFCNVGKGSTNGISRYDSAILTAVDSGEVKVWRFDEQDQIVINAGENLHRMRHSKANKNIIATGGREHKLKLFDLEKQAQTFVEKNLPHDWLQLRVPIWISDIGFLPNTDHVVTTGRYGHIRLYDAKAQRRPVIHMDVKDEALTTLAITPREKQIIIGTGKGGMNLVDLRKPGRVLNTYKGAVGGITGIACSKSYPYVASVGLDRYLRVHHMDTKAQLKAVYLTSKLTCMLLRSEFSWEPDEEEKGENGEEISVDRNGNSDVREKLSAKETETDSDAEYDVLFDKMQVVTNKEDRTILKDEKRKQNVQQDSSSDGENEIYSNVRQSKKRKQTSKKTSKKSKSK